MIKNLLRFQSNTILSKHGASGGSSVLSQRLISILNRVRTPFDQNSDFESNKISSETEDIDTMFDNDNNYLPDLHIPGRQWEYTTFGRTLEASKYHQTITGNGTRLVLMSYNLLAPTLLKDHTYLYSDCESEHLDFAGRTKKFFQEVVDHRPDVICLQEVEAAVYESSYVREFKRLGYNGEYKQRTGDKVDGCAIFYRRSVLSLVDKLAVEFNRPDINEVLNRDNIGLLLKLESRENHRSTVIVGTTHLLYNPKRPEIKFAQAHLFLSAIEDFSLREINSRNEKVFYPAIITGDFNSIPNSPIVRYVTEGKYASTEGELPEFSHNLKFRNSYASKLDRIDGNGTVATTKQTGWICVDYVFYSTVWNSRFNNAIEGSLKLVRRLGLYNRKQCLKLGNLPNANCPSDHYPLLTEFLLKPLSNRWRR